MVAISRLSAYWPLSELLEIAPVRWPFFWPILAAIILTLSIDNLTLILSTSNRQVSCPFPHPRVIKPQTQPHPIKKTELMTGQEIYQYLRWTNSDSCQFSVDFGRYYVFLSSNLSEPDGPKAVCCDKNVTPVFGDCLVYSFGLSNQWSFLDAMNEFACQIYSFDPLKKIKFDRTDHDPNRHIFFYEIGLDGQDRIHPTMKWTMKTATSIYQMLTELHGPKLIDVMKVDVEFAEWDAIPQMLRSGFLGDKVKQLTVELHFQANDTLETYQHRIAILQDLESDSLSSDGRIGRFVRFASRHNPGRKRPIRILNNKLGYIGFEIAWYNSRFYDDTAN